MAKIKRGFCKDCCKDTVDLLGVCTECGATVRGEALTDREIDLILGECNGGLMYRLDCNDLEKHENDFGDLY